MVPGEKKVSLNSAFFCFAAGIPFMQRRKLHLKAKVERSALMFCFQSLRSRRFQRGFHRVNLHRHTLNS
jgi:hypothetical protein